MSDQALSQDEVDALLRGVTGELPEEAETVVEDDGIRLYDIGRQERIVRGRMPGLELVNERAARQIRLGFYNFMRRSAEISVGPVRIEKYSEFIRKLVVPTNINLVSLQPELYGTALFIFDPNLVFQVVDTLFGGTGKIHMRVEGREFTTTEQRVIHLVLKSIIEAIKLGWKALADVDFRLIETEMNPAAISAYSATDVVVVRPFKVSFDGGGGEVQLLMPGNVLDSIFRHKGNGVDEERNRELLRQRSLRFITTVTGELSGANLTIGELFKLSEGDIITVDSPEKVDMKINGVAKFKARMGEVNGRVGLKILG